MTFIVLPLWFAAGVVSWTWTEYWLHRKLGHRKDRHNPFTVEHLRHHRDTNYFAKTSKKIVAAVLVFAVLTPLFGLLFSWPVGFCFSAGFSAMYLLYEILHRRAHTSAPKTAYGFWLRKHHFHHHYQNPRVNHGVTSHIWDAVFGTLEVPAKVRIPRRYVLDWMLDPKSNMLWPHLESDYELRGRLSG